MTYVDGAVRYERGQTLDEGLVRFVEDARRRMLTKTGTEFFSPTSS